MKGIMKYGLVLGTGAAVNVSLGWVPSHVAIYNTTDGDLITEAFLAANIMPFTSGGTTDIPVGSKITGATSGATASVRQVLLVSGTFAAGTAAGWFLVDRVVGTFASENVKLAGGTDDATVTAIVTPNIAVAAAAASATGNAAISRYEGAAASAAPGFTIGSTVSESGKALFYAARREDD